MKLADIDLHELHEALRTERSAWITAPREEGRDQTDAERITMCVLFALEHVLEKVMAAHD
jgi:hypothetical protein